MQGHAVTPIPRSMIEVLDAFGMVGSNMRILDVGCRDGRFVKEVMNRKLDYWGFDVDEKYIKKARLTFPENFHFRFVNLKNDMYNPEGTLNPETYDFPYTEPFDTVFCSSIFTHTTFKTVHNYLTNIANLLKIGGRAYVTWFRDPPNDYRKSSDMRSVFKESEIMNLVANFEVIHTEGGLTDDYNDQWKMILQK